MRNVFSLFFVQIYQLNQVLAIIEETLLNFPPLPRCWASEASRFLLEQRGLFEVGTFGATGATVGSLKARRLG